MSIQGTKEATTTNKDGFFTGAIKTAEQIAHVGLTVEKLKENASHVIEDGIADAKRMVKKGRYAAEDLVDDTAHYIKKDPFRSVGVTFGVGFGLGAIVGLLVAYKAKASRNN